MPLALPFTEERIVLSLTFSGDKRKDDVGKGIEKTRQSRREDWRGFLFSFLFSVFYMVDNKP